MSHVIQQDYVGLANMLRAQREPAIRDDLLRFNLNIILAALDIAAADPAPPLAEPEADGDRTVHPSMDRVPDTMTLLRRVTELEKLANATAGYIVDGSPNRELRAVRDAWLSTRAEWLKMRGKEWV